MYDLVIHDGTLVSSTGVNRVDLAIQGEKIIEIAPHLVGRERISAMGMLVLPGGVDPHVHLEMPTPATVTSDIWETGSKAALYGGTTTVIDFVEPGYDGQPLLEAFKERLKVAQGKSEVDFSFHMTLCSASPQVLSQVNEVVRAGMPSFKMYTTYPGFHLTDEELLAAFEAVGSSGGLAVVHAESDAIIQKATGRLRMEGRLSVSDFAESRPRIAEKEAVERVLSLAAYTETPVYIVHISSRGGAEAIALARKQGQAVWGETCPQYLLLDEFRLKTSDFSGAKFVCCPPLRGVEDQQTLWSGLCEGSIQTIGTDHCAFNYKGQKVLERESFLEIPSGLPGIELRMALIYTFGVKPGLLTLAQWVTLCCTNPARLFGLYPRKGDLLPGSDADIVIFDPDWKEPITREILHENVDYTPYEGLELQGKVRTTLLRGKPKVSDGVWVGNSIDGGYIQCSSFHPG